MLNELHHISTFSGIGGFDLAAERAGLATLATAEINPFARGVLARHWPAARHFDSIQCLNLFLQTSSLPAVFRVRISAPPTLPAKESTARAPVCGRSYFSRFAYYDPRSQCLKTPQTSLIEDLERFSATLPASGMMRNGSLYLLGNSVAPTCENAFLSLPTPTASDSMRVRFSLESLAKAHRRKQLDGRRWGGNLSEVLAGKIGAAVSPSLAGWMMGFPLNWCRPNFTPTATPCARP